MKLELWDDMHTLEQRFDEMLRDAFGMRTLNLWPLRLQPRVVAPSSDVFSRNGDLVVRVELPGLDPEHDVSVTVEDHELVVMGTRTNTEETKEEDYYRKEVWSGAFERRVPLPAGITEQAVEATYDKGVLEVVVHGGAPALPNPKETPATPRSIPVTTKS